MSVISRPAVSAIQETSVLLDPEDENIGDVMEALIVPTRRSAAFVEVSAIAMEDDDD